MWIHGCLFYSSIFFLICQLLACFVPSYSALSCKNQWECFLLTIQLTFGMTAMLFWEKWSDDNFTSLVLFVKQKNSKFLSSFYFSLDRWECWMLAVWTRFSFSHWEKWLMDPQMRVLLSFPHHNSFPPPKSTKTSMSHKKLGTNGIFYFIQQVN